MIDYVVRKFFEKGFLMFDFFCQRKKKLALFAVFLTMVFLFCTPERALADIYFPPDDARKFVLSFDLMGLNGNLTTEKIMSVIESQGYKNKYPEKQNGVKVNKIIFENEKKMSFTILSPARTNVYDAPWKVLSFRSFNEQCPENVVQEFYKVCEGNFLEYGPCYEKTVSGDKMISLSTKLGKRASDGYTYSMNMKIIKTGQCTVSISRGVKVGN